MASQACRSSAVVPAAWTALVVAGIAATGGATSDRRALVAAAIGALWAGGALAPGGFRQRGLALALMPLAEGAAFAAVVAARGVGYPAMVAAVAVVAGSASATVAWGPTWHALGLAAAGAACCAAGPPGAGVAALAGGALAAAGAAAVIVAILARVAGGLDPDRGSGVVPVPAVVLTAAAVTIALTLAHAAGLPRAYWAAVTVVLVFQPGAAITWGTAWRRAAAALAAAVVVVALGLLGLGRAALALVIAAAVAIGFVAAPRSKPLFWACQSVAVMLLVESAIGSADGWELGLARVGETLLGLAVVAVAAALLPWLRRVL